MVSSHRYTRFTHCVGCISSSRLTAAFLIYIVKDKFSQHDAALKNIENSIIQMIISVNFKVTEVFCSSKNVGMGVFWVHENIYYSIHGYSSWSKYLWYTNTFSIISLWLRLFERFDNGISLFKWFFCSSENVGMGALLGP